MKTLVPIFLVFIVSLFIGSSFGSLWQWIFIGACSLIATIIFCIKNKKQGD